MIKIDPEQYKEIFLMSIFFLGLFAKIFKSVKTF